MFLWCMSPEFCQRWITIESMNAFKYIAVLKFICLTHKLNFLSDEFWKSIWKLVDDVIIT